ncbi:hypothetical protein BBK36DRAFT_1118816, partial [Trichoderma citrinoviride]
MEATGSSVTILFPQRFWKQVDSLPADGQKIAWSIRYLLSSLQPKTSFTWWLLFPEPKDSDWKTRWQALLTPDLRRNPYALIAKDARRGSPNDLYYDNINLETIERPDPRHTPAVNVFCSRDERTVSLLGGAADEGRWLLTKGLECESTKLPAYVLPLPGSEWKSQKSDDELYGIRGTGFPTAFLMYTTLKQHRHSAPLRRVTATQAATMTTALCEGLAVAENRAYNALRDAERKLAKMKEQEAEDEDGDDIAEQEELVAGIHEQKFLDVAAPKILSYIATFSPEADREIPDAEPDVKRLYDAYNYAKELRRQDSEDEIEHRTRTNWPFGLKRPPVRLDVAQPFPSDLGAYLNDLSRFKGKTTIRIQYDVDDKSFQHECSGISEMNRLALDSPEAQWWNFVVAFDRSLMPTVCDLTERFTGLGKAVKQGRFIGQHAQAIKTFKEAVFGRVSLVGGPGSGKSTLATNVVAAMLEGEMAEVPSRPRKEADYDAKMREMGEAGQLLETEGYAPMADDSTNLADLARRAHDVAQATEGQAPMADDSMDPADSARRAHDAALDILIDSLRVTDASNTLSPSDSDSRDDSSLSKLTPIVWTAPQNTQVGDAVLRLQAKVQNKRIIRIYPYDDELRVFMAAVLHGPEDMAIDENSPHSAKRLIAHINGFRAALYVERNPATDPSSLAMQLREEVEQNPDAYPEIKEAWDLQVSNPANYMVNKRDYFDSARKIIADFVCKADVIAGTPVALRMLYNHVPVLKPCFVVIDEAGRLTESMAVLPIARHADVPALWIGDVKQFGPIAAAEQDIEYNPIFTAQRKRSLLARMEGAGQ